MTDTGHLALQRGRVWRRGTATLGLGVLVASLLTLVPSPAHTAQIEAWWQWAQSVPSDGYSEGGEVLQMPDGSLVVAGGYQGNAYFASTVLSAPSGGIFLAGVPSDGADFTWASTAYALSGGLLSLDSAVALDADTITLSGVFGGTAIFPLNAAGDDSVALVARGSRDGFVAAFDARNKSFLWVRQMGAAGKQTTADSLDVGSRGVIMTGSFQGIAYFPTAADDSIAITGGANGGNGYIAQMSLDDSYFDWVQPIAVPDGGSTSVSLPSVATNDANDTIIAGYFQGTVAFPVSASSSVSLTSAGLLDMFVARMNADDSYFSWVRPAGGTGLDQAQRVALDDSGNSFVIGNFAGTVAFPTSAADAITLTSQRASDPFIARVNADDSYFRWVQTVSTSGSVYGSALALRPDGAPVITFGADGSVWLPSGPEADDSIAVPWSSDDHIIVAEMNVDDSYFAWAQTAGGSSGDYAYATGMTIVDGCAPVVTGGFGVNMTFPESATQGITLNAPSTYDAFLGLLAPTGCRARPAPPVPGPAIPASAPRDVTAEAGDGSAAVSWSAPASNGSFAVSTYQVTSSPGGRACLVSAPSLSCEVTGLVNGTSYTFAVRALTGAGWSPSSEPSNAVTPIAPVQPSIVITGSRDGKRIEIAGVSTGLQMGAELRPWTRFPGQSTYAEGTATILVSMDGTFEWGRKTGKRVSVYVQTPDGSVRSNVVTIQAR